MQRVATFMSIKPGMEERYRTEHQSIWPEVLEGIARYGIKNYTIFMLGRELYSYLEVEDLDKAMAMAAADPVNQRWQEHMAPLLDVGSGVKDGSTVYPEEVFHTDGYTQLSTPMQRVATLMVLKEGVQDQYKEAHRDVWPEILEGIARVRIRNYSIFMIGRKLFSYFEVEDLEKAMAEIAADPINQKWQAYMAPLFDIGSGIKEASTVYPEEAFHLD